MYPSGTRFRFVCFQPLGEPLGREGQGLLGVHTGQRVKLVDRDTPNVTVADMGESRGVRGTDHAHLVFDRAPVPVSDTLGEEGKGLLVAFGGFLTPSRIAVATTCVGLARRAQDNDDMAKMLLQVRRAHAQSGLYASNAGQSGAALPAGGQG